MRKIAILTVVVAVVAFSWMSASLLHAKPEISKETGKACTFCHTKAGKPDLNDKGKCYKEKGSLDDC